MKNKSIIDTAVILAGGEGRRLHPHTASVPKPLVAVGNRPVIEHLLEHVKRCGIQTVHLAVGHRADQIREKLKDGSQLGLDLRYHVETIPLSTIGPLSLIGDLPDHFFVINGDILTNLDMKKLSAVHIESQAIMTVVICPRTERIDYGVIETDAANSVHAFTEKPTYSYLVSSGIYCMSRRICDFIPKGERFGFDDLVRVLLESRERIHTHRFHGYWLDIGRPEDYERACREIDSIGFDFPE